METYQQSAIDVHKTELCEALGLTREAFLFRLQVTDILSSDELQIIQESSQLDSARILTTLEILKHKAGGFSAIISYLRQNNLVTTMKKLELATVNLGEMTFNDQLEASQYESRSVIEKFISTLVKFYLGNFGAVESFGGDSEHIDSVWVDIQMKGDKSSTANYSDIFDRMHEIHCQTSVIEGQPGTGKTTLAKKIAYDWAKLTKSNRNNKRIPFDLILVVSLRSVQSSVNLFELAVKHLMGGTASETKVRIIVDSVRHLDLRVLLILDGLDEWEIQPSSPLAKIFGSAVNRVENKQLVDKIDFDFDLMITSRPYACELINENFWAIRWKIIGLSEIRQSEFVKLRCKTESGRNRAAEYLKNSTVLREIGQIPLLLLLVCYLADENIEVPTNLTRLYEAFVHRMLIRSAKKGSIATICLDNWRKSELVASLGRLALLGVVKNKFEFSRDEMEMCRVKDESFKSGLLLFRSDPLNLTAKADFAHRSIQEFLAALHSVHFWTKDLTITNITGWPKEIWSISIISEMKVHMLAAKMISFGGSQFCRFYFGLLSGQSEFGVNMRKLLEEYVEINLIYSNFLFCLSNSLADCSDAECISTGEVVYNLIDKSFDWTKSGWSKVQVRKENLFLWTEEKRIDVWPDPTKAEFRPQFQSGLKLKWLKNSLNSFYLGRESQTEGKIIHIWLNEENLLEKVGELQILKEVDWLYISHSGPVDFDMLKFAMYVLKLLPKSRNYGILDESAEYFVVRLLLGRKAEVQVNSCHSCVDSEFLFFAVDKSVGEKIYNRLSSLRQTNSGEVEIESIEETSSNARRLKLAVSSSSRWIVWDFLQNEAG